MSDAGATAQSGTQRKMEPMNFAVQISNRQQQQRCVGLEMEPSGLK